MVKNTWIKNIGIVLTIVCCFSLQSFDLGKPMPKNEPAIAHIDLAEK